MMDSIRARAHPRYIWSRRWYILKLLWLHPEWLRALVALLIALPVYIFTVMGIASLALFVPLIILINFVGLGWAVILWAILYGFLAYRFNKWRQRMNSIRPRRRPHYINDNQSKT
jgi:membrane protein implicated in regulation of membrane protease activity